MVRRQGPDYIDFYRPLLSLGRQRRTIEKSLELFGLVPTVIAARLRHFSRARRTLIHLTGPRKSTWTLQFWRGDPDGAAEDWIVRWRGSQPCTLCHHGPPSICSKYTQSPTIEQWYPIDWSDASALRRRYVPARLSGTAGVSCTVRAFASRARGRQFRSRHHARLTYNKTRRYLHNPCDPHAASNGQVKAESGRRRYVACACSTQGVQRSRRYTFDGDGPVVY